MCHIFFIYSSVDGHLGCFHESTLFWIWQQVTHLVPQVNLFFSPPSLSRLLWSPNPPQSGPGTGGSEGCPQVHGSLTQLRERQHIRGGMRSLSPPEVPQTCSFQLRESHPHAIEFDLKFRHDSPWHWIVTIPMVVMSQEPKENHLTFQVKDNLKWAHFSQNHADTRGKKASNFVAVAVLQTCYEKLNLFTEKANQTIPIGKRRCFASLWKCMGPSAMNRDVVQTFPSQPSQVFW